jgi:hypothetical protein
MTPYLSFKKAYVKIFSGKGSWAKRLAGAAFVLGTPVALINTIDHEPLSQQRDAVIGAQQYQKLDEAIERLALDHKKVNQSYWRLDGYTQNQVLHQGDADHAKKLADEKVNYQQSHSKYIRDLNSFRDMVLVSRGISEKDAVDLFTKVEARAGASMFPNDDLWQKKMRYLDECQSGAFNASIKTAGKPGDVNDNTQAVLKCQREHIDDKAGTAAGYLFGGLLGSGLSLVFLSAMGAGFRESIPDHQKRAGAQQAAATRRREEKTSGRKTVTFEIK